MDSERDRGLPPGVETAWGLRERPSRGPKRGLSVPRIVEAAVGLAIADGLTAVSMSKVAAALGTSPMSLYRYVSGKDELIVLMVDTTYGTPPPAPPPEKSWRARLTHWARAERTVLYRHPWILRVPITAPPSTPHIMEWMEQGLAALHGTGLPEKAKLSAILLVTGFVRNEATLAADIEVAARGAGVSPDEAMAAYARLMRDLTGNGRFPAITAALDSGALDAPDGPDDEFDWGLERILDGIGLLIAAGPHQHR